MKLYSVAMMLTVSVLAVPTYANFALSMNGQKVLCRGEDNVTIEIDAQRSTLKYTVEGESSGPQKIESADVTQYKSVSYTSLDGVLTLSDSGDTYLYAGDQEAATGDCR